VQFIELCRQMGLLATASIAIDGSKFKAVTPATRTSRAGKWNGGAHSWRRAWRVISAQLDTADLQEPSEELAAKTAHLKEENWSSWKARCSVWRRWRS